MEGTTTQARGVAKQRMEGTTKKLATLVGCNYAGTPYELHGCINDVLAACDTLVARFGFAPGGISLLTDDHRRRLPTGANIKRALADMVSRAAPGDVLFFHFSGHGTLIPRRRGHDEAIVPCDFKIITDGEFRRLVDRVPQGATFTMVSDSCHSGGLIAQEEQIGPNVPVPDLTTRFLPYPAVVGHLSGASGIDTPTPRPDGGILLSGCQADETSAEVTWRKGKNKCGAFGAFSSAVQAVLAAHPAPVSNRELVNRAREMLSNQGLCECNVIKIVVRV